MSSEIDVNTYIRHVALDKSMINHHIVATVESIVVVPNSLLQDLCEKKTPLIWGARIPHNAPKVCQESPSRPQLLLQGVSISQTHHHREVI